MALELVGYEDLKNHLGLTENTIEAYPALKVIRLSVTVAIENYLGRYLESTSRTQVVYAGEKYLGMISLKGIPVSSITSATVATEEVSETLTSDDYNITRYGIKLLSPIRNGKVTVVYTGGISAATDNIERAALLQTIYEFQNKDNLGAQTVSTEGGTVTRPPLGLLKEVKKMLVGERHPLRI